MALPEAGPSPAGARVVFVYYRVEPRQAAALQQAFAAVVDAAGDWQPRLMRKVAEDYDGQAAVHEPTGRRPEDLQPEDLQTWMEVYRPPPAAPLSNDALRSFVDDGVRRAGILELITGERHYEIFEPCA